ncbi:MAG: hypothetical protein WCT42_00740 [Candidatus Paceibacterota bacterium]
MKKYVFKLMVLFLVIGFVPSFANAANIYFETTKNTVSVGDIFIVSAKIDSKGTEVNSVEGDFVLDLNNSNIVVNDFSLAKSIFSLWPRTPSLSKDGNTISFVGGVPGGFDLDKAILFNIILQADKEGDIKISPKNIAVFANDGKGTRLPIEVSSLDIKVLPKNESVAPNNEWSTLVTGDKTNPEDFDIVVGKDSTLFEGRRFAFFTAVDNQSGISYYEVSENDNPAIRSGSMYVLENQGEDDINLKVTAYDKAGNKTDSVYKKPGFMVFGFPLSFFIIIIISWFLFMRIKRNKKNVQKEQ